MKIIKKLCCKFINNLFYHHIMYILINYLLEGQILYYHVLFLVIEKYMNNNFCI
jgi:hypothetical protein